MAMRVTEDIKRQICDAALEYAIANPLKDYATRNIRTNSFITGAQCGYELAVDQITGILWDECNEDSGNSILATTLLKQLTGIDFYDNRNTVQ